MFYCCCSNINVTFFCFEGIVWISMSVGEIRPSYTLVFQMTQVFVCV